MLFWTHRCNGTYRNEQWTVVGASDVHTALSDQSDSTYVSSPANKNRVAVTFPVDISDIPVGAKITSLTVYIRCNRTSSTPRSVTVNVIPKDKTSCYTSRTIYPSQTITTYEVASYRFDPRGYLWTRHRLNQLILQAFSYSKVSGGIRIYELYAQINYEPIPTVSVTSPTGTVLTPSPTISWTYSQIDGDPQASAEYKIYTSVEAEKASFNVNASPPVYRGTVDGDITSVILPTSINPDIYYVYVRATSQHGAVSAWANRSFLVAGPSPGIPGTGDPTVPGGGVATVTASNATSSIQLEVRDTSNMLSVQQADFETETDGLEYTTVNCSIVRDTVTFSTGVASGKLTAASAADMAVLSGPLEIDEGAPITARAQFKAATTGRSVQVKCRFYDVNFGFISEITSAAASDSTSTWTDVVVTGTSPTGVKYAEVRLNVLAPALNEVHNIEKVGLMYGTNSAWNHGGHTSRNLLDSYTATAEDPAQTSGWLAGSGATLTNVTTLGTGSHGTKTHRLTYNGISPTIAIRATGVAFTSPTAGVNYVLNKPASVAAGDLMIAFVSSNESGSITPPSGWTVVNEASINDGSSDSALFVLKRTATSSEPASWNGNLTVSSTRRYAVVVAYSGAADAADQFIAENVATRSANTPLTITSNTVYNSDSNAWRVSAFAVNDNSGTGTMVANINPPSVPLEIQYVGAATAWGKNSSTTSWTVNKPYGVVSGDLMIATVAAHGNITTVNAPTGWTLVRKQTHTGNSKTLTYAIFKRTAGSSEPTSWSSTFSSAAAVVLTECTAYRNADTAANQFIAENTSSGVNTYSQINTTTITNTDSRAWRVSGFVTLDPFPSSAITSNETSERVQAIQQSVDQDLSMTINDSNGPVATGSHYRIGYFNSTYNAAAAWIGLIKPLPTPPPGVPNETERNDTTVGSATPWLTTGVYDSNGVIPIGNTSVTAQFTPGSGTDIDSAASWIGIIKPANPIVAGRATANMAESVDISNIDSSILTLANNKVTLSGAFLGSTTGTPYLVMYFYNANELLTSLVAQGDSFETGTWTLTSGTFDVPENTTRVKAGLYVSDRSAGDHVYFDRMSIALGESSVWRNGTGRSAHPIWTVPLIQFADDDGSGYTDWSDLSGQIAHPPAFNDVSGLATYTDHTAIPLITRKYRVKTVSYGLAGDVFVSPYGPDSTETSLTVENWWLKDINDPTVNMQLKVRRQRIGITKTNKTSMFQPIGENYPVVLTEGYKADSFELTIKCDRADWVRLTDLLDSGKTLYLQSNVDEAWWVRPIGDLAHEILTTNDMESNPIRLVKVTFAEVAPVL